MSGRALPGRTSTARRSSRRSGLAVFVLAAALPPVLWHDVIADIWVSSDADELGILLVGWAPWVLMALGLACFVPPAITHLRDREHRFHRPGPGAWAGWGISLYLLGFALAIQVAQIHALHS